MHVEAHGLTPIFPYVQHSSQREEKDRSLKYPQVPEIVPSYEILLDTSISVAVGDYTTSTITVKLRTWPGPYFPCGAWLTSSKIKNAPGESGWHDSRLLSKWQVLRWVLLPYNERWPEKFDFALAENNIITITFFRS
jgi:hypothetical protein